MNNETRPKDENSNADTVIEKLSDKVEELSSNMEKMRLAEYIEMLENPRRLFYINFLLGLARGFGSAIGFTVLAAIVIYVMQKIVVLNMPLIGDFIAHIVEIVQRELSVGGTVFNHIPGKI